MNEQRIDEKRLAEIEARANDVMRYPWRYCPGWSEAHDLVADLRAARAEIERLRSHATALMMELGAAGERDEQAWKAEIERLKSEADRRVADERARIEAIVTKRAGMARGIGPQVALQTLAEEIRGLR